MKRTILTTLVAGLMLATIFSACFSASAIFRRAPEEVGQLDGTISWWRTDEPLENAVVYIAGGHIEIDSDPFYIDVDLLITHNVTNESGYYEFNSVPKGPYTIIVIGPNSTGEPVYINIRGGIFGSSFFPGIRFTRVYEGEITTENINLFKRPLKGYDSDGDEENNDNSCFLEGTRISMADGTYKNIEDIEIGDMVKSYDVNTGELVDAEVTMVYHHSPEEMTEYYVVINGGIRVTPNHLLYINGEFIPAGEAQEGDLLTSSSGEGILIESIEQVFDQVPTYNFEVSTDGGLTSSSNYIISSASGSSSPEIEELPASKPAYSSQQNSLQSIQGNNNQQSQQSSPSK